MSTIKFVPMEFFAQFGLTQMRRLQARGGVGAAFSGAGRGWWAQVAVCRHGAAFMGMGRRLRAWGAVGAASRERGGVVDRGVAVCGRGALSARLFLVRGRRWWAQVAVCTAFPAQGAYCERWALSARLSGSGAGLAIVGSPFVRLSRRRVPIVNAGRCRCGFPGTGTSLADVGRCLRAWGAVGAAFFGAWSPLVGAGRRLRA